MSDPATAEMLTPQDFPLGTKRLAQDDGYFETFNRDNVTLVDIRTAPIEEITPTGLRTADGEYELDAIVFATGFDAVTGAALAIDIRGRGGLPLREKWAGGRASISASPPRASRTCSRSPARAARRCSATWCSRSSSTWTGSATRSDYLREHDLATIEATPDAEDAWVEHVAEVGNATLFPLADSWYVGANIPGKTRVLLPYLGGFGPYSKICADVAAGGYAEFALA